MDIAEAILHRRSIRAFKPDSISPEILREIMETAVFAPSWNNTQPWEFAIVSGKKIEEIKQAYVEKTKAGETANVDLTPPK
ncbi:nitroreductase family protein [Chloroflexota bacterium]